MTRYDLTSYIHYPHLLEKHDIGPLASVQAGPVGRINIMGVSHLDFAPGLDPAQLLFFDWHGSGPEIIGPF